MFTIAELSREVEAIRDKRRMIRLGPNVPQGDITVPPATVLPSVLAHTLFDGGEG
jgi:transcription initiation factor TFIID subunit 5